VNIRVDIEQLVIHDRSMSRRARINLRDDIGRELRDLARRRANPAASDRRSPPSVAAQIAAAVVARLPPAGPARTVPRS
jgi:hypothetical protein